MVHVPKLSKFRRVIKSREPRKYSNSEVYHIILRGTDKQDIFYDDMDRNVFKSYLKSTKKKFSYQVYSYCLMSNHVHLVIKVNEKNLSNSIQNLALKYSKYFNKKYNRTGHLFENRFKSKNVENKKYLLDVCRYVHRNPEKALIEKVEKYKWSSYQEYIKKPDIVDTKIILYYFGNDINKFKEYMKVSKYDNIKYLEYEMLKSFSDEELTQILIEELPISSISEFLKADKRKKEEYILKIKSMEISNITQVARVTKVNRKIVERIWKR